ncbi:hypothetical protein VC218_11450 [Xanthomonas nasturtii]|uniref:hypothetical protein n=1 Tax=Xanthomonas nasturtii TaxID=1843581 RepID=UPI002B22BA3E|nr:hypothetical protein [Xanthomonas nasturtii]MEA9579502.1 hypothetical protein [Xanthomonas nasturtii]
MISLEAITEVESRYSGFNGMPSLGEAFAMLQERWEFGDRDRETALRLLFLAWYSCSEPTCLTGLPDDQRTSTIFVDTFAALGGEQSSDAEVCFAVGPMAELFPRCIGDEAHWLALGNKLSSRAHELSPQGFPPSFFKGRGSYGEYFAHIAASHKAGS